MNNADINVLLLEDDQQLLQALAEVLEDAGYRVQAIGDSGRAVELSLDQDFDIVITDIRMAGMDGLDALARVREVQPEVRSLVVTGFSSEVDTIRALRLGVGEYLSKPFRMEQFRDAVERLVAQVRQQRVSYRHEVSLRKLMIWALEHYAQQIATPWHVAAGRTARQLALRMQLGEGGGEAVQLACLCTVLQANDLPDFIGDTLPRRILAILQAEQGLENSIIDAARRLAQDMPLDDTIPPAIRQAAERINTNQEEIPAAPAQQRRTTLSLAIALERAEQIEQAIKAYQALVVPPPSREAVIAAQSLAWLAHRLGKAKQVRDYALQAVNISRHLGPLSVASAACDAGILLASVDAPEAAEILDEAELLCGRLNFPGRQAQVQLALAWLRAKPIPQAALALLLQSGQDELMQSAWWLAPVLLEGYAAKELTDPEARSLLQRSLARMLTEKPATMHQLVRSGRLSPDARMALVSFEPSADTLELLSADSDAGVRNEATRKRTTGVAAKQPPVLRIFSLGVQEIFYGEDRLPDDVFKKNQKARHMLTYLAMDRGRPVSEELLGEYFWPDEGSRGRKNIYSIRSIWRKALQPPGFSEEIEYVVRTPGGLMMNPELVWWHDVEELRRSLRNWEVLEKSQRQAEAVAPLRRAAQLYRGPFLESCYLDWSISIREQLEFQMIQALLRLAGLVLEQHLALSGGHRTESLLCSEAQEVCQRVLELDPCSQEAYRLAMLAFLESGRPQDAIRLYERCVKVLNREMKAEPSIPVLELYTRARLSL